MWRLVRIAGLVLIGIAVGWATTPNPAEWLLNANYDLGVSHGRNMARVDGLDRVFTGISRTIEWCESAGFVLRSRGPQVAPEDQT